MEQHNLQSTFNVIYRVNADEQARDAIIDRERFLRDQRTQQDIKRRLEEQLAEQTGIIAEQSNTIAEQSNRINELKAKIAEYEAKLASKSN